MENKKGIGIFQKYLSVWVILCMIAGVLIGRFLPQVPEFLNRLEYAKVSVPMAANSSIAMAAEGPPMPVEHTDTFSPSSVPV